MNMSGFVLSTAFLCIKNKPIGLFLGIFLYLCSYHSIMLKN